MVILENQMLETKLANKMNFLLIKNLNPQLNIYIIDFTYFMGKVIPIFALQSKTMFIFSPVRLKKTLQGLVQIYSCKN